MKYKEIRAVCNLCGKAIHVGEVVCHVIVDSENGEVETHCCWSCNDIGKLYKRKSTDKV